MNKVMNAEVLKKLRTFDTPTVCNVIELFNIRPRNTGYMDHRIRACYPKLPPMVGFAATATFRADSPPVDGESYAGMTEQIESFANLPGPPIVVFQDLDDPVVAATFGEVMCTTYKAFGAVGLITSGAARDLDQVAALEFPCFASETICSHGYCHFPQINSPIRVGGLQVRPGDLLHGDCNGVTNIPVEIAADVADACPELMAAEEIVLSCLRAGDAGPKKFRDSRAECENRLRELSQRLGN